MRLREKDEPLGPEARRELEAIDRALAGEPVPADLAGLESLAGMLREERPEPGPGWCEREDERLRAGYRGDDGRPGPVRGRARGLGAGRLLAPAGALATLAVVVVVGVSTLGDTGGGGDEMLGSDGAAPALVAPESSEETEILKPAPGASLDGGAIGDPGGGERLAPGIEQRRVERDVLLTLSTPPDEVREVSDEAIAITRGLGGIVVSSQVSESEASSSATLELTIPTRNLDTAVDRLTELANVESLNESAIDITRPFVSAADRVDDAEAERRELLEALGNATTDEEAEALRLQIADARREISRAESAFDKVARRARLSDLSLTVAGDPDAAGERTIGDWLDDAVDVLRDVAGVLLISAAIVLPLGLLAAIGWIATARLRRRRRERALDQPS